MRSSLRSKLALSVLALLPGAALAHHSFAVFFDSEKSITLTGVVTEFKFVNPHGLIVLQIKNKDGALEEWKVETNSPSILRRRGWTPRVSWPGKPSPSRAGRAAMTRITRACAAPSRGMAKPSASRSDGGLMPMQRVYRRMAGFGVLCAAALSLMASVAAAAGKPAKGPGGHPDLAGFWNLSGKIGWIGCRPTRSSWAIPAPSSFRGASTAG
ncbi:MAG: DUF6152 family protein [Gammaproteobacteria bacterium]